MTHRWSGWPGAWCMDCGSDDLNEVAIADGADPWTDPWTEQNQPCPSPGAALYDPYVRLKEEREHVAAVHSGG